MIEFAEPLLLILAPLAVGIGGRGLTRRPAIIFSSVELLDVDVRPSLRERLAWLPMALRLIWLGLLAVALAGPRWATFDPLSGEASRSLAIVLDLSGSMAAVEGRSAGRDVTRLDQAKALIRELLSLEKGNRGAERSSESIALIALIQSPEVRSPPTRDVAAFLALLETQAIDRLENKTNLGDAVALAIDTLERTGLASRRVFVISDGAHNVAEALTPAAAASMAAALRIPIDCLALGSVATAESAAAFERDQDTLRRLAATTGGRFVPYGPSAARELGVEKSQAVAGSDQPKTREYRDITRYVVALTIIVAAAEVLARRAGLQVWPA